MMLLGPYIFVGCVLAIISIANSIATIRDQLVMDVPQKKIDPWEPVWTCVVSLTAWPLFLCIAVFIAASDTLEIVKLLREKKNE